MSQPRIAAVGTTIPFQSKTHRRPRHRAGGVVLACAEALERRQLLAGGPDRLLNNNAGSNGTQFFTQSETTVVAFGNNVVVGFNDSGSNASGSHFTGWAYSSDGGTTFTDGGVLPASGGGDAGDPSLARNNTTGRIYLSTLQFSGAGIQIFRSDDNGVTWSPPVQGAPEKSGTQDKEWVTVDNYPGAGNGNVYLAERDFGTGAGIFLFRSTDNGGTFTPSGGTRITTNQQGAYVVVGPDHSVYVFWYNGTTLQMRKSTDQGVTFAAPVVVASGLLGGTNGDLSLTGLRNGLGTFSGFRSQEFPTVAVNPVTGNLYVVYNNRGVSPDKADIFFVQSTDGGTTWSAPLKVNDDATTTDQWQPDVAVTPDGLNLGIFYYSRQEDTASNNQYRAYGRLATIAGPVITFAPSSAVSDVASLPEFGRDSVVVSTYMGDYNSCFATAGGFHVVWSDNRSDLPGGGTRKDPNVYYDFVPLAVPPAPIVVTSGFQYATLPQKVTFTFDQDVSASLTLDDIVVTDVTHSTTVTPSGLSYDLGTNTATVTFTGVLPDARYTAKLIAAGITNGSGTPLAADYTLPFFFLMGDANHDATVDLLDFNILALNFGLAGRDFTQGNFDYSGLVDLLDFNLLSTRFGTSVGPEALIKSIYTPAKQARVIDSLRQELLA